MKKTKRKKSQRDKRWKEALVKRDGEECKLCGGIGTDPCHIVGRSLSVRWILENGFIGCRSCHIKFDDKKNRFREKIINVVIGRELYDRLKEIKNGKRTAEYYGFKEIN